MTDQAHAGLTANDVKLLARLVTAVEHSHPVQWARDDDLDVRTGTVRRFNYATGSVDLRDATVRITTSSGTEMDMPVTEALDLLARGAMGFKGAR